MMFADEIDDKLGVPKEYANIALIPMGYPMGRWGRPDRKPALSVTFWENGAPAAIPSRSPRIRKTDLGVAGPNLSSARHISSSAFALKDPWIGARQIRGV